MKKRSTFTLVEILVVIGIISVLAGLVFGAVAIAQASGRNTQAKSDMASIIMAVRGVENTYGKLVNSKVESEKTVVRFGNYKAKILNTTDTGDFLCIGQPAKADHSGSTQNSEYAYDAFIAELSVPENSALKSSTESYLNVNRRKLVFLEPKADFNPAASYKKQREKLWRDPWGNRYTVLINISGKKHLKLRGVSNAPTSNASNTKSFNIASDVAAYSHGPNGIDNGGCHADLDKCINYKDEENHKLHDDIASWRK